MSELDGMWMSWNAPSVSIGAVVTDGTAVFEEDPGPVALARREGVEIPAEVRIEARGHRP